MSEAMVVFACSDKREFCVAALEHAKKQYPGYGVYLRTDFGSIQEFTGFPRKLSEHHTFKIILQLGISKFVAYAHEYCAAYEEIVKGMSREEERFHQEGELRAFEYRLREIIPSAEISLYYQKLDERKEAVADTDYVVYVNCNEI